MGMSPLLPVGVSNPPAYKYLDRRNAARLDEPIPQIFEAFLPVFPFRGRGEALAIDAAVQFYTEFTPVGADEENGFGFPRSG